MATLGVMRDDGLKGDRMAGDGVFTLAVAVSETGTTAYYRASAAPRGKLVCRCYAWTFPWSISFPVIHLLVDRHSLTTATTVLVLRD